MGKRLRAGIVYSLIFSFAAALASTPAVAATPLDWEFEVRLNDRKIGYHSFRLSDDNGRQILETEAAFDVKLLFVTAFRYRHKNREVWEDGCLERVQAQTDANGKLFEVRGVRRADAMTVTTRDEQTRLADCVRSFAYWNPEVLSSTRLLNTQTGEYESVTVIPDGEDRVAVGDRVVEADRYRLRTQNGDIRLWYAKETRTWLKLEAPAKGGRTLRYTPLTVPAAA